MENSVLFSSYGFAGRLISNDPEHMPFTSKLLCGSFSGLCVATVLTPVELIKCRMQTANAGAVKYDNSWQCECSILPLRCSVECLPAGWEPRAAKLGRAQVC